MANLTNKLTQFFNSNHSQWNEFLTETATQAAWIDALALFRTGMKKLKENDLSGMEDIKNANKNLEIVVNGHKNDKVLTQAQALNESITTFNKEKLEEEVEAIGYQLTEVYKALKEAGMPAMLNEEEMYEEMEDECVKEECIPVKEDALASVPPATVSSTPAPAAQSGSALPAASTGTVGAAPVSAPAPTTGPITSTGSAPAVPVTEVKVSAYEEGFNEARKRWNKGGAAKNMAKDIATKELSEKSYAHVNRWMEGFNAGFSYHEEVMKDTDPKMFEETEPAK